MKGLQTMEVMLVLPGQRSTAWPNIPCKQGPTPTELSWENDRQEVWAKRQRD